jgi:predicted 3-demethylubiquinone-9 3-methyltransferase (glyoxalase superfamily)
MSMFEEFPRTTPLLRFKANAMEAMMQMKKFDIAALERAAQG